MEAAKRVDLKSSYNEKNSCNYEVMDVLSKLILIIITQ